MKGRNKNVLMCVFAGARVLSEKKGLPRRVHHLDAMLLPHPLHRLDVSSLMGVENCGESGGVQVNSFLCLKGEKMVNCPVSHQRIPKKP